MKPLRIGILSTASIVPRFVGAAGTMTDCKITALASRNLFRAREKAALWNIPLTFGSYEDLIASDAVDISIPGMGSVEEVERNAAAASTRISFFIVPPSGKYTTCIPVSQS